LDVHINLEVFLHGPNIENTSGCEGLSEGVVRTTKESRPAPVPGSRTSFLLVWHPFVDLRRFPPYRHRFLLAGAQPFPYSKEHVAPLGFSPRPSSLFFGHKKDIVRAQISQLSFWLGVAPRLKAFLYMGRRNYVTEPLRLTVSVVPLLSYDTQYLSLSAVFF